MGRKLVAALLGAMLYSSVQAATVFSPTDTTVNFIRLFGSSSAPIGLFDDSDQGYSGGYLAVQSSEDQVTFSPNGADFDLTNASGIAPNIFILSGSNRFMLAAWSYGLSAWLEPDAISCSSVSGSCSLSWSGLFVDLAVDLVQAPPYTTIPLPTSLLLFGSGLIGLVVVARRRTPGK